MMITKLWQRNSIGGEKKPKQTGVLLHQSLKINLSAWHILESKCRVFGHNRFMYH